MLKLLIFITKNFYYVLFLLLQTIAIYLTFSFNNYHNSLFFNFTNEIVGFVRKQTSYFKRLFNTQNENKKLVRQNVFLLKYYLNKKYEENQSKLEILSKTFNVIAANVIYITSNKKENYIIIDKGSNNGIENEMGVLSSTGIVGKVIYVSDNFSIIMPIINVKSSISAKIKNSNYYCYVEWDGQDYNYAILKDLPEHVKLSHNDTIITSGLSLIFPKNLPIGIVDSSKKDNNNLFKIKLFTDFSKLCYVFLVKNNYKNEFSSLQKIILNE